MITLHKTKQRKRLGVIGNCVTGVIPHYLQTSEKFNKDYEIEKLKPVFLINTDQDVQEFKSQIAKQNNKTV